MTHRFSDAYDTLYTVVHLKSKIAHAAFSETLMRAVLRLMVLTVCCRKSECMMVVFFPSG